MCLNSFLICLLMPEYAWICLSMSKHVWICLDLPEWLLFYISHCNPCLPGFNVSLPTCLVSYLPGYLPGYLFQRLHETKRNMKEHEVVFLKGQNFSTVAESIWFALDKRFLQVIFQVCCYLWGLMGQGAVILDIPKLKS